MPLFDRLKSAFAGSRLDVEARFEFLRGPYPGRKSTVHVVRDRQTGETRALKLLDAKKTAEFEARFKGLNKPSEGEISIKFDHPNIVKTFEHGVTTEGSPYLLMEPLGTGLNSLLPHGPQIFPGRRLTYFRQVAEALEVVHQKGFIHRDLSPRNLLFTEDGQTLKLTDFGGALPASGRFLEPGNRTGTPHYMAPELIRLQRTDTRLDVFAFGVIAYQMCTFHIPWEGEAAAVHSQAPVDIRRWWPEMHPALADLIMSCIHPDVNKRCPSMAKFLQDLRRVPSETA